MSNNEPSSAERRREENIRKNREFQMQIGQTSFGASEVVSPLEMKIRQNYVKRKNVKDATRKLRRIEKQVEAKSSRKEKMQKRKEFRCKYCYQVYRNARALPNVSVLSLHQRNPKCAMYHLDSTSFDIGLLVSLIISFNWTLPNEVTIT